jgi:hypothetical protein
MRLITFILKLFCKQKTYAALFSEALAEGIKETMEEMGYQSKDEVSKNEVLS